MPPYLYEFDDLVEQQKQGELERTQKIQNRTRVLPSLDEITRMEAVICWPMDFLMFGSPQLVEAVMWVSHAHSMGRDIDWVCANAVVLSIRGVNAIRVDVRSSRPV
jgi:hypothetical protein